MFHLLQSTALLLLIICDDSITIADTISSSESSSSSSNGEKCTRNSINLGKIIDALLTDYDTHLLPEADGVNVTIELHVQGVSGISEITADFELDVMYSEIWHDPRLGFKHLNVCTTNITVSCV